MKHALADLRWIIAYKLLGLVLKVAPADRESDNLAAVLLGWGLANRRRNLAEKKAVTGRYKVDEADL